MFISHTIIHIGDKARLLLLETRLHGLYTITGLDYWTHAFFPLVLDCSIRVLQWRWWEVKSVAEAIMDVD